MGIVSRALLFGRVVAGFVTGVIAGLIRSLGLARVVRIVAVELFALGFVGVAQELLRDRFFFGQQRFAVGHGDAVVVGMDLAEGQEAVAVAAVFHKSRLERRFNARHFGEIDVTF